MKHREEDQVLHHQGLILHAAVVVVEVVAEVAEAKAAVEAEVAEEEEAKVDLPTTLRLLPIPQTHQPQNDQ